MPRIGSSAVAVFALAAAVSSAGAADIPRPMASRAPATVSYFDWTGFYVGAFAGIGLQRSHGYDPSGNTLGDLDYLGSGFTGGIAAGYNWQFSTTWVAGIEADIGYLGISRQTLDWNDSFAYNSKTSWVGTVRGRLGYNNGPTLFYYTAGGAFVGVKDSLVFNTGASLQESSKTRGGYALGSGIETMLGGNWIAKAEYMFIDAGSGDTLLLPASIYNVEVDKHRYHLMKYGVNYLFGGRPQPALPANNWTGLYGGIVYGIGVMEARGFDPTVGTTGEIGNNGSGLTIGGIVGYNWQFAPYWVAGVEGDFSWLGIDRSAAQYNDFNAAGTRNAVLGVKTDWIATVRGRVGYSTGPALLYLTGGAAWVNVRDSWQGSVGLGGGPLVTSSETLSGYAVGGGIEAMARGNWSVRTEYLYVDVGDGALLSSTANLQVDHKFHMFRSSLTYRFGAGPISTRY